MSPVKPGRQTKRVRRAGLGVIALIAAAGGGVGVAVSGATTSSSASHSRVSGATVRQERVLDAAYTRIVAHPSGVGVPVVDYGVGKLWAEGIDGAGTTVAVMGEWYEPARIKQALAGEDARYGLPAAKITPIYPSGKHRLPARCPAAMTKGWALGTCRAWEAELELDVSAVHVMAPYAKIVVSVTPSTGGTTPGAVNEDATPGIMQGVEAISRRHLANVVSFSGDLAESSDRHGRSEVTAQDPGLLAPAIAGIPFLSVTGDCGAAQNLPTATVQCARISRRRGTGAPDDSSWTLAVGGSIPDGSTAMIGSSRVESNPSYPSAPGAGFSTIDARPAYQNGVASSTHSAMRSVPDITMDNAGGTSESAPLMAGVLALATQANGGHDLGPINTALYDVLGPRGAADGISDVTLGNNSVTSFKNDGHFHVKGFSAHKGFDVVSGWGTIYAPRFVPALAKADQASHGEAASRSQAAAQLQTLRHAMTLTGSRLSTTGFFPGSPVTLSIDGQKVAALHADDHGDIIDTLRLSAGSHTLTLSSTLITITRKLTSR